MTREILVTGATGLVGAHLTRALAGAGHAVRAPTRRPEKARLPPGAQSIGWDGRQLPPEALAGCEAVVHLAGEPIFGGRLTEARRRRILASRIDSTRSIVASIGALPSDRRPASLVSASAVGYYGSRGDTVLEEAAAPGEGFLADVCRQWEAAAREAEAHGVRVVTLRIGVVLARDGGALPLLSLPFRFALGGRLGDGRQWFPWIHVEDLVGLIQACLGDPGYRGPVNAVAPESVTNADLTRTLGRVLGRPTPLPVPAFVLRTALGELSEELLGSRRVTPAAAREHGFEFAWPRLEPALAALLG
jgi:uncharacterized protein (TIGR01777 family)